uniref:Uncharacterized protein n=1 Tax=Anguilla anguilla TaxID=7936 RepID=A0A0E9VU95_ANGAN
MEWCQAVSP